VEPKGKRLRMDAGFHRMGWGNRKRIHPGKKGRVVIRSKQITAWLKARGRVDGLGDLPYFLLFRTLIRFGSGQNFGRSFPLLGQLEFGSALGNVGTPIQEFGPRHCPSLPGRDRFW